MNRVWAILPAAAAAVLASGAANAAPPTASGFAEANVVTPGSIVPIEMLRFGQFIRPAAAGTLTISVANNGAVTITPAGGVTAASIGIAQTGLGRGEASFELTGTPNRQTDVTLPAAPITISNGAQTMTVNTFSANTNGGGKLKLDATGHATLLVGARLNVAANQAVGNYTGTYNITVVFN